MDRFKDFYNQEPNYTRLFLLFFLFLVSIFYYIDTDAYGADLESDQNTHFYGSSVHAQNVSFGEDNLFGEKRNEKD